MPWDLKAIITSTATDVAAPGIDYQTGHGLINSYRAVKEVLRRKAVRTGQDPAPYTGREPGDALDIAAETAALIRFEIKIVRVVAGGQAAQVGLRAGDVLLRYDDVPITTPTGLRAVVAAVVQKRKEQVVFVVERRGKEMQFTVKPGKLGISLGAEYLAPVFK